MLMAVLSVARHPLTILLVGAAPAIMDYTNMDSKSVADLVTGRRLEECDDACILHITIISTVVAIAVPIIIWLVFACMYKSKVTDQRPLFQGGQPSSLAALEANGLCNCCSDIHLCLHSWCCMDDRAADTFQVAGVGAFWMVVIAFVIDWILYEVVAFILTAFVFPPEQAQYKPGSVFAWFITSALMGLWLASKRSELRRKFSGTPNFALDCICYWWCMPCSVAQDAMLLDHANGVRVECCCNLIKSCAVQVPVTAAVVGQPVRSME